MGLDLSVTDKTNLLPALGNPTFLPETTLGDMGVADDHASQVANESSSETAKLLTTAQLKAMRLSERRLVLSLNPHHDKSELDRISLELTGLELEISLLEEKLRDETDASCSSDVISGSLISSLVMPNSWADPSKVENLIHAFTQKVNSMTKVVQEEREKEEISEDEASNPWFNPSAIAELITTMGDVVQTVTNNIKLDDEARQILIRTQLDALPE
jgi:hypothetical protein